MTVAVASGKGGTGKTTVAVALAMAVPGPVQLLDCDVEEPNAHLFLPLADPASRPEYVMVPVIDGSACSACGLCSGFCQFNALATVGNGTMVFPELCHACGACRLLCPAGAIKEEPMRIGVIETGTAGAIAFARGLLDVGQSLSTALIRAVRASAREGLTIIDCPPGTACPMVAAVRRADYAILVTEPTPFGLNDLALAVATVRQLEIPCGVVINRSDAGDERVADYCRDQGIPVLLRIPEDRRIAEAYSRGQALVAARPDLAVAFRQVLAEVGV